MDFNKDIGSEGFVKIDTKLMEWLKGDWNKLTYMTNYMVGLVKKLPVENCITDTIKAFGGNRKGFNQWVLPDVIKRLVQEIHEQNQEMRSFRDLQYEVKQYEDNGIIKVLRKFNIIKIEKRP